MTGFVTLSVTQRLDGLIVTILWPHFQIQGTKSPPGAFPKQLLKLFILPSKSVETLLGNRN